MKPQTFLHTLLLAVAGSILASPALVAQDSGMPITGLPQTDPTVDHLFALEDLQVMDHLSQLVDGIGPRLTSSDNLTEACEWAADRMREFGLQNVRLEEWGTFPVGFNRRLMTGRQLAPLKQALVFTTMAWAAGTDGPSRGPVRLGPANPEEIASMKGTLKGSWILTSGARPRYDNDGDSFGAQLGNFFDEEGILGTISAGRGELVHTGGRSRIDYDNLPHRVAVSLRRDQWQDMHRTLEAGEAVEVEFDLDYEFVQGPIPLYNVIGEIPGETDELVIIGGHIDSWDGARGAQDNGTGTATTLEVARLLADLGQKPKRTIRFMLWSGEEQGLLGSRAYIKANPEELDRISCVLVHDGGTNACAGIYATPAMMPMFEEIFAPIIEHTKDLEEEALRFTLREVARLPKGIGSDHDSYLSAPNPAPGFFWDQRGETSYGFIHHTQNDLYQYAERKYEEYTSRVVASAAWRFANASTMVPRKGMLGPKPKRIGVQLAQDGITIEQLTPGGMAAKAGIKKGDRIVRIGEASITGRNDLRAAIKKAGDREEITVRRGEQDLVFVFDWKAGKAEARK
jgi:carboxypeptidase Q